MPYCTNCGTETQIGSRFCQSCGHSTGTQVQALNYRISPKRVIILSILTWSLYFIYWLYITWKQYRDHSGQEVFPVWHALTQFVPIYGLFRVHAHARTFEELMTGANLATTISPGTAVALVVVFGAINGATFQLTSGEITQGVATGLFIIDVVSVALVIGSYPCRGRSTGTGTTWPVPLLQT